MNGVTQDNSRENSIIDYCGLLSLKIRHGIDCFHPESGVPFEVKTTTKKSRAISTAREVHLRKIEKWRSQYWLFGSGTGKGADFQLDKLYLAHPSNLAVFFDKCESKFSYNIKLVEPVLTAAQLQGVNPEIIQVAKRLFARGAELDDPSISWKLVTSCTELPTNDAQEARLIIDLFVQEFPLPTTKYSLQEQGLEAGKYRHSLQDDLNLFKIKLPYHLVVIPNPDIETLPSTDTHQSPRPCKS